MTESLFAKPFQRRSLLKAALSVPIAATASKALAGGTYADAEGKTVDELYEAAKAEGGKLVIYAGGDRPWDSRTDDFLKRFPDIDLNIIVDYSKYHDVRVDNQFATGSVVPDVVQLQTLQDFTRWKKAGRLLRFKPRGFANIHEAFKDPDGAWTAIGAFAFSYMYDPAGPAPANPRDFVKPEWKGKIASSYPHDDDAVLFLYKLYVEAYGWRWLRALADQDIQFARGSHTPRVAVTNKEKPLGIGGSGSLLAVDQPARWTVAKGHPFMAWGQRAAILKGSPNQSAAKLYISWQVSRERQEKAANGWSIRTDVQPAGGLKPIWEYADSNLYGFPKFMEDRAEVERWKQTFALYFGEVKGEPTPGILGLHPGA